MQKQQTIRYIYVGRLDTEKWVDCIINSFSHYFDDWSLDISLDIFGRGALSLDIQQFADRYPNVTYHGFQNKSVVFKTRKEVDYCLMPSRFLETFGLSALDSLSVWVPIVSPNKWWLTSFVLPQLTMQSVTPQELSRVIGVAQQIKRSGQHYLDLSLQSKEIYFQYWWSLWYTRIIELWLPKNLLVVTDYWANHGWIETLIEEIDEWLKKQWHILRHFVSTSKQLNQLQRYLWLIKTLANIWSAYGIWTLSWSFELIWWHSVHRQLWWLPIFASSRLSNHRIMVHDMWLLHPFPAFVEEEIQIQHASTFVGRIQEWINAKWWIWFPLLVAKRISVWLIRWQIRIKSMTVQVPSTYLKNHVQKKLSDSQKVLVVPHFILPHMDDWNKNS